MLWRLSITVSLGLLLAASLTHARRLSCYSNTTSPSRLYAIWTEYDTVRSQEQPPTEEAVPGCSPVGLFLVARHGTRHTSLADVQQMNLMLPQLRDEIKQAHAQGKGELCAEDLAGLDAWDSPMPDDQDTTLGETGWTEFRGLGDRYKTRYPTLLNRNYTDEDFAFMYTDIRSNRTLDSTKALCEGIFGTYDGISMGPAPAPDTIIRFYENCPKWDAEVGDHPVEEMEKFIAGPEMSRTLRAMEERAGLAEKYFSYESAELVYHNCRVEYGLYQEAPWCALFSDEDLETFEYTEDLLYYWRDSYAHDINWQMTCDLNKELINFLRDHVEDGSGPSFRSINGHGPTVNALYTSLGLFEPDENLRADNWDADRPFRVSEHTPMAGHIALALYQCADGGGAEEYRIKSFVNEAATQIPGCPLDEYDTCSYEDFAALFGERADSCDFEQICEVDSLNSADSMKAYMSIVTLLAMVWTFVVASV